jgi:hypothetical protein
MIFAARQTRPTSIQHKRAWFMQHPAHECGQFEHATYESTWFKHSTCNWRNNSNSKHATGKTTPFSKHELAIQVHFQNMQLAKQRTSKHATGETTHFQTCNWRNNALPKHAFDFSEYERRTMPGGRCQTIDKVHVCACVRVTHVWDSLVNPLRSD